MLCSPMLSPTDTPHRLRLRAPRLQLLSSSTGQRADTDMTPLEPGTKLGPYEILAPFRAGSSADEYKASDTRINRPVVLKLLPPRFLESEEVKQRLKQETQTIASLKHPHISAVVDVGSQVPSTGSELAIDFFVTEYLEGETLAQRLTSGRLEVVEALKVAIEIAGALDRAHRQGLTHRGLNPSNVMLTSSGTKLLDFGMARPNEQAVLPVSASGAI